MDDFELDHMEPHEIEEGYDDYDETQFGDDRMDQRETYAQDRVRIAKEKRFRKKEIREERTSNRKGRV